MNTAKPQRVMKTRAPKEAKEVTESKPKIKKPASAYILFSNDIRASVVKENPTLKGKDVVKVIAEKWKTLGAVEKKKYEDLHSTAKKQYEELKKQNDI